MAGIWRLFVAIYPPPAVAEALLRSLDPHAAGIPPHRRLDVEQIHLTVQFIGEVSPRDLDSVIESVIAAAKGIRGFDLAPLHLVTIPRDPPSRLVAALTDSPSALIELHQRLISRLARRHRERDGFVPHMTLCRFASPSATATLSVPVHMESFFVDEVRLMRSTLTAAGARHELIESIPLHR